MNKFGYLLASTALAGVMATAGTANAGSASKAVAGVSNLNAFNLSALAGESTTTVSGTLMELFIKTANAKDLFINVAMQCGLSTTTRVKNETATESTTTSKSGRKAKVSTSDANASLEIRVLFDDSNDKVLPGGGSSNTGTTAQNPTFDLGWVTFCQRSQTLEAILGQGLVCADVNTIPGIQFQDECDLTDQEISLAISTLSASSFNFIVPDVGPGDHTVKIEARAAVAAFESGDFSDTNVVHVTPATALAILGLGSVTVEEVRMVRGTEVDLDK